MPFIGNIQYWHPRYSPEICYILIVAERAVGLNFFLDGPPLTFSSSHGMKSHCASVFHHSTTGDLLVGCADGVERMSSAGGDVIDVTDGGAPEVAEYDGEIFIFTQKDEIVRILKYKPSESVAAVEHEELFRFPAKNTQARFLSVSVCHRSWQ